MSEKDDGGQVIGALFLRDLFAIAALPLVAKKWDEWQESDPEADGKDWVSCDATVTCVAEDAYFIADELLKVRAK